MKKIKLCIAVIALLIGYAINPATAQVKQQMTQLISDSKLDFVVNQGPAISPVIEEEGNKTKFYEARPKYKGEVSMLRDQERNGVVYKSLIYGWKLNKNTPKDVKQEAENMRKAAIKIMQEKEASGGYKSYKVKTTDSSMRTELRDSVGGRIMEIVESKKYFHLIIFGEKWRTDTVDGLTSDFTIEGILCKKEKIQTLK